MNIKRENNSRVLKRLSLGYHESDCTVKMNDIEKKKMMNLNFVSVVRVNSQTFLWECLVCIWRLDLRKEIRDGILDVEVFYIEIMVEIVAV